MLPAEHGALGEGYSALVLQLLSTVELPTTTLFVLLLHSCNFAAVINCTVNTCFPMLLDSPCERAVDPPTGP